MQRQVESEEEEEEAVQTKLADGARLQRQAEPEEDEEEETVQTARTAGQTPQDGAGLAARVRSLGRGGQPLPRSTRSSFEARFGYDFGDVRVHTDSESAQMAQKLRARAFTVGKDVYFATGKYDLATARGKELLAHELTHVVQQSGPRAPAAPMVQRAAKEYLVRGRYTPKKGKGLDNWVFFEQATHTLAGEEEKRIRDFAAGMRGNKVTLFGYASEEGEQGTNKRLATDRMLEVAKVLAQLGVTVVKSEERSKVSHRLIDYRRWRAVEIVTTERDSTLASDVTGKANRPFNDKEVGIFGRVKTRASKLIDQALKKLKPAPSPETIGHVNRLFGPRTAVASIDKIHSNLSSIQTEINSMISRCFRGTARNLDCRRGQIASTGKNDYMFCRKFFDLKDLDQQARILVHEASHGTPTLRTEDYAYGYERLIEALGRFEQDKTLKNADSYSVLVMLLNSISSFEFLPPRDVYRFTGDKASDKRKKVKDAISYAQSWVSVSKYMLGLLYWQIHKYVDENRAWDPEDWPYDIVKATAASFALTRPVHPPRRSDAWKAAALFDRYKTMKGILQKPLTFRESASGGAWEKGPGTKVEVAPTFYSHPLRRRIRILLWQLAAVMPQIGRPLASACVNLAQQLHKLRKKIFAIKAKQ